MVFLFHNVQNITIERCYEINFREVIFKWQVMRFLLHLEFI